MYLLCSTNYSFLKFVQAEKGSIQYKNVYYSHLKTVKQKSQYIM